MLAKIVHMTILRHNVNIRTNTCYRSLKIWVRIAKPLLINSEFITILFLDVLNVII